MAGASRKVGKPTNWREAGGASGPPKIGGGRRWQPGEASGPRKGGKWVKVVALTLGLAALAGGVGYLYWVLAPTKTPVFAAVSARPAAVATRLNAPPDHAGWRTAEQLVTWAMAQEKLDPKAARVAHEAGKPLTLSADAGGLEPFVDKLAAAGRGPLIAYLGLHTVVQADKQPALWVDGGRQLLVADLLAAVTKKLGDRDVVLLFDNGRLAPDPVVGLLADQFADRLENDPKVKKELDDNRRLTLVCGAAPGQPGWESEELQLTAFGKAVLDALRGTGGDDREVTGDALFQAVATQTRAWTAGNRPIPQTPVVLPKDAGRDRTGRLIYHLATPADLPGKPPALAADGVKKLWEDHDRLAAGSPAAYAPLAWRRGRELLVRCQQAVRLGDADSVAALDAAVKDEFARVAKAAEVKTLDRGRFASLPLAEAAGESEAVGMAKELDLLAGKDWKNADIGRFGKTTERRPAEAHLPVMVKAFYDTADPGKPQPLPDWWPQAFRTRREAERAAFGSPHGERSWAAVREAVQRADAARRPAEDQLFATTPPTEAVPRLAELEKDYRAAAALGAMVRNGSKLRDRMFADLPFAGRWAAASSKPEEVTQVVLNAWKAAWELVAALDAPAAEPLVAAVAAAERGWDAVQKTLEAARRFDPPEGQSAWAGLQPLIACPLVPALTRADALDKCLKKTTAWLAGEPVPAAAEAPAAALLARSREHAVVVAQLAAASLGRRLMKAQHEASKDKLPSYDRLATDLGDVSANKKEADALPGLAADLAGHFAEADRAALPRDYPDPAAVLAAEPASRSAVLLDRRSSDAEPAEAAAAVRWRELLAALADRAFRDYWRGEVNTGTPYWKTTADNLLADARAAYRGGLPKVAVGLDPPRDFPADTDLSLTPAADSAKRLSWTTQRKQTVRFELAASLPDAVAGGVAVGWQAAGGGHVGWEGSADRRPLQLDKKEQLERTLVAARPDEEVERATDRPSARAYFRGRAQTAEIEVRVSRLPEREILEPAPTDARGTIGVRAEPDLPIGQVTILLDYSGSMRKRLDNPDKEEFERPDNKETRFKTMLAGLRQVLLLLPPKTPLRIRQFSALDRHPTAKEFNADSIPVSRAPVDIFPEPGGKPEVDWDGPNSQRLKDLMERLAGYFPTFDTPLAASIDAAVRDGFDRQGEANKLAKTLVVLTDGVEEKAGDKREALPGRQAAGRETLSDAFRGRGQDVGLFVVPLGLDKADKALADALFADIPRNPIPGRLLPAADRIETRVLKDQLSDAIFPKLRVEGEDALTAQGLDRTGHPSRPDRKRDGRPPYSESNGTTDLYWSPWLRATNYKATPNVNPGGGTDLDLRNEDTLILAFGRDPGGKVQVRRELYADYHLQERHVTNRRKPPGDGWVVTCPHPVVGDRGRLEALVFVERLPPHRRNTPDRAPPRQLSADPPDAAGDGREVVWFDLLPVDPMTRKGRITVERKYKYGAPVWRVGRDGWLGGVDDSVQVRATVATREDGLPNPLPLEVSTPRDGEEKLWGPEDGITARVSVEDSRPGLPAEAGFKWVVVRVRHPEGRPVFARLLLPRPSDRPLDANHRYYPSADKMADYTAAFKLTADAAQGLPMVRVNLARVDWAVARDNQDRLAVTLDPAKPDRDRDREPQVITPPDPPAK